MRKLTNTLLLVSILVAGLATSPVLHAQGSQDSSDSMMGHGMMDHRNDAGGMMGMSKMMKQMKQMNQMMDHCSSMMSNNRPSEQ